MSKGTTFSADLLALIFNGTTIANIAINATSGPLTSYYMALHTADPGEAGFQNTSEIAYTGYARVAIARTSGGFTCTGTVVNLTANCDWPVMTAGAGGIATYASIGTASSGAGKILYSGAIAPEINVIVGTVPRITPATIFTED